MPDEPEFPEFNPEYEAFDPSEMGWVRVADRIWEKPNGEKYIFPPGGQEVLIRLKLPGLFRK
jgi:hypothetical protein